MSLLNRRSFLKGTLAAAATITIAGTKSSGKVLGPTTRSDRRRRLNGRAANTSSNFAGMKDVQITYLHRPRHEDLGPPRLGSREDRQRDAETCRRPQGPRRQNLDAISIATPNHWHS